MPYNQFLALLISFGGTILSVFQFFFEKKAKREECTIPDIYNPILFLVIASKYALHSDYIGLALSGITIVFLMLHMIIRR